MLEKQNEKGGLWWLPNDGMGCKVQESGSKSFFHRLRVVSNIIEFRMLNINVNLDR